MSKIIKLTPELMDSIRKEFEEELSKATPEIIRGEFDKMLDSAKLSDGKVCYTKTFNFSKAIGVSDRKATLIFTEKAYEKMMALVREFDKEIAWHGIAKRGDDPTKDEYIVSDILVYPQSVSGANVTTDQERYQTWLMSHDDDVFNNIRMQGHSHVFMGTSPSSVDTTWYDSIIAQLDDTMFYIFLIWNKRGDKYIKIYDFAKNIIFDTSDVIVSIDYDGVGSASFVRDSKEMVREITPTYNTGTYYSGGYGGSSYGAGGYSSNNGVGQKGAAATAPAAATSVEKEKKAADVKTAATVTSISTASVKKKEEAQEKQGANWFQKLISGVAMQLKLRV